MCGRYVSITKLKEVEKRFGVIAKKPELFVQNSNVSHGEYAPVITNEAPAELQFYQFGFTPEWSNKQTYIVNARAEGDYNKDDSLQYSGAAGIINKPMFRKAIRSQRCLVIADAFIEGSKQERLNKPYLVYLRDNQRPFAMAGVWDKWKNKVTGELINSFAIITTVANEVLQEIGHHRSPVIIPRDYEKDWLSNDLPLSDATAMLSPYPAVQMNAYPISPEIRHAKSNGIDLLKPVGERVRKEYDYEVYEELKLEGMGMTRARQRKNSNGIQGTLF